MRSNGCAGGGSDRMSNQGLKKGPWTAAEDAILMEYVKKHGEGNWNSVQKNSGLMRCGKSCRLRWANHLRPNLKKGSFSSEEERIIIQLHAKLGNKWARMAAQLPGRTDNEIKNYWNTRMKRRQRAGLPIYPQLQQQQQQQVAGDHDVAAGSLLQQQQHDQQEQEQEQYQGRIKRHCSSNSLSSTSYQMSSPQTRHDCVSSNNFSLLDSMNSLSAGGQNQVAIPSFYSNLYTNTGFALPLSSQISPRSPFVSSSSNLYDQNITGQLPAPSSFQFDSGSNFQHPLSFSSLLMGGHQSPVELASFQTLPQPATSTTPTTSSYTSSGTGGVCMVASSGNTNNSININNYPASENTSSGLLDAVLVESRSLSHNERNKDGEEYLQSQVIDKGKNVIADHMDAAANNVEEEREDDGNKCGFEKHGHDLSSSQSSMGVKPVSDHGSIEEMNSMDDDLLSLLNNFPSSTPLPEWYTNTTRNKSSNGLSSGGNMEADADEQNVSPAPPTTTTATPHDQLDRRALGSYCWKNMPGIC